MTTLDLFLIGLTITAILYAVLRAYRIYRDHLDTLEDLDKRIHDLFWRVSRLEDKDERARYGGESIGQRILALEKAAGIKPAVIVTDGDGEDCEGDDNDPWDAIHERVNDTNERVRTLENTIKSHQDYAVDRNRGTQGDGPTIAGVALQLYNLKSRVDSHIAQSASDFAALGEKIAALQKAEPWHESIQAQNISARLNNISNEATRANKRIDNWTGQASTTAELETGIKRLDWRIAKVAAKVEKLEKNERWADEFAGSLGTE